MPTLSVVSPRLVMVKVRSTVRAPCSNGAKISVPLLALASFEPSVIAWPLPVIRAVASVPVILPVISKVYGLSLASLAGMLTTPEKTLGTVVGRLTVKEVVSPGLTLATRLLTRMNPAGKVGGPKIRAWCLPYR